MIVLKDDPMPTMIRVLNPDLSLDIPAYTAETLAAAGEHEPFDGIYTVTNTYQTTKVLKLDAHLDRLEDSARRASIPLELNRAAIRKTLRSMIQEAQYGDVRFRITVPRAQTDQYILTIEPYTKPSESILHEGVRCVTIGIHRENAAAKTLDWMHERTAIERSLPKGIYTALLCNPAQEILEGVSSNFYAITKDKLYTATEGVLAGIAQQIVFEIAPPIISIMHHPISVAEIEDIDEAFITSSSRGIIPVIEIDGISVSQGKRGQITQQLQQAYAAWSTTHLEEL
jgi:branched-chain amino acid aminotransferase